MTRMDSLLVVVVAIAVRASCGNERSETHTEDESVNSAIEVAALPLVYPFDVARYTFPFEIGYGGGPPLSSLHGLIGPVWTVSVESSAGPQSARYGYELDRDARVRVHWDESDGVTSTWRFEYDDVTGDAVALTVQHEGSDIRGPEAYAFRRATEDGKSVIHKADSATGDVVQTEVQSYEDGVLTITMERPAGSGNITVLTYEPFPGRHTELVRLDDRFATVTGTFTSEWQFLWTDDLVQREMRRNVTADRSVTFDYSYDDNGFLAGWREEGSDGTTREFRRSELEVDERGNWTRIALATADGFEISRNRAFTYFDSP
jgi:hypothetical protein